MKMEIHIYTEKGNMKRENYKKKEKKKRPK
jgi:hypothetical protein